MPLPDPIASYLDPWAGALTAADPARADELVRLAIAAAIEIRGLVEMKDGLEGAMRDAELRTAEAANHLKRSIAGLSSPDVVAKAIRAAETAVEELRDRLRAARPSAKAVNLGVGWSVEDA